MLTKDGRQLGWELRMWRLVALASCIREEHPGMGQARRLKLLVGVEDDPVHYLLSQLVMCNGGILGEGVEGF